MRSDVISSRWLRIIFIVIMGATPAAFAMENSEYNPAGQARVHAAVWSVFQMQSQCSDALARDPASGITATAATEDLLNQLIGHDLPRVKQRASNGLSIWESIDSIHPVERDTIAAHVLRFQDAFRADPKKTYIIGHAIRGADNIRSYAGRALYEYTLAQARLTNSKEELQAKDRYQTIKSAGRVIGVGAAAAAVSYLGAELNSSFLQIGAPILATPFLFAPLTRISAYFQGDSRFRKWFGPANRDTDYATLLAATDKILKQPESGFFMETEFTLLASTFHALRTDQEKALSELRRSCVAQSASRKCEEYTGYMEAVHLNDNSLVNASLKVADDAKEAKQKSLSLKGRLASAFFHDSKTGEPVWISWIAIALNPVDSGGQRVEAVREKAAKFSQDLELAPIPARAKSSRRPR